ncbi:unnamed protein product [Ectocarpus sp. 6 AP-2014]
MAPPCIEGAVTWRRERHSGHQTRCPQVSPVATLPEKRSSTREEKVFGVYFAPLLYSLAHLIISPLSQLAPVRIPKYDNIESILIYFVTQRAKQAPPPSYGTTLMIKKYLTTTLAPPNPVLETGVIGYREYKRDKLASLRI